MAKNVGPRGETRERIRALRAEGLTPQEIARALNMTTQNAYQHLARIKADEEKAS